ncbi:MAG: hypothetical protein A4E57_02674 [Syntrophorhabdaceae bacterium PtaU1.Bin034]|jgi:sugar-specific transcriptional regulator TrmB|nr:MAG: hypothetical protein A4E57_02674 [Syntrophorhabdaceae bacterium PtaU1.Bin034]
MDEEKDKRINDFRLRFDVLSEELKRLRDEWVEAHNKKDITRETQLVHREKDLFDQVHDVITGLAGLLKQSRAA